MNNVSDENALYQSINQTHSDRMTCFIDTISYPGLMPSQHYFFVLDRNEVGVGREALLIAARVCGAT